MEANKRLEKMIGNVYEYEGRKVTIQDAKVSGAFGILETDTGNIKISLDNIDEELNFFILHKPNQMIRNPTVMQMISQSGEMYGVLQNTLLDTIKKLQEDSQYVIQAQAINDTMKSIIDLEKVKIQTLSLLK